MAVEDDSLYLRPASLTPTNNRQPLLERGPKVKTALRYRDSLAFTLDTDDLWEVSDTIVGRARQQAERLFILGRLDGAV